MVPVWKGDGRNYPAPLLEYDAKTLDITKNDGSTEHIDMHKRKYAGLQFSAAYDDVDNPTECLLRVESDQNDMITEDYAIKVTDWASFSDQHPLLVGKFPNQPKE